jgi:hypothetical protein
MIVKAISRRTVGKWRTPRENSQLIISKLMIFAMGQKLKPSVAAAAG